MPENTGMEQTTEDYERAVDAQFQAAMWALDTAMRDSDQQEDDSERPTGLAAFYSARMR